jgi:hypothetical protein
MADDSASQCELSLVSRIVVNVAQSRFLPENISNEIERITSNLTLMSISATITIVICRPGF